MHWWADVVVDDQGTPYVVWSEIPHGVIYFSHYDGSDWTSPVVVNDTTEVKSSDWSSARLVRDRQGVLHLSYTGQAAGADYADVFYAFYDGAHWSPSVKVSTDSTTDNYYGAISARSSSDVWIAWCTDISDRIYISHYDGSRWSSETRLDDSTTNGNDSPEVVQDSIGLPWVAWEDDAASTGQEVISCNRMSSTVSVNEGQLTRRTPLASITASSSAFSLRKVALTYRIPASGEVRLEVYDMAGRTVRVLVNGDEGSGEHHIEWNGNDQLGRGSPSGAYFCRLKFGSTIKTCKVVLLNT
jgi:hypothetical protein